MLRLQTSALVLVVAVFLDGRVGAADKKGISPSHISLPSGPGSIEGLGESFEPQLNTGTATYAVKFALPPGRAGHTPSLGVAYNGGSGNGVLGMGWSLTGLSYVQRQTDKGLPAYRPSDTIVTSDGEELVPLSDGTLRAENEGGFRRYHFDRAATVWTCDLPDGTKLTYGTDAESRIEQTGSCDGTCSNTGQACSTAVECTRTFRWYLTASTDPNGNITRYHYRPFQPLLAPFDGTDRMVYLDRVEYTLHTTRTLPGRHVVLFTYEQRTDAIADYRPGFELVTAFRLRRVDVCTVGLSEDAVSAIQGSSTTCPADRAGAPDAQRIRAYEMGYEDDERFGVCDQSTHTCTRGLKGALCVAAADCVAGAARLVEVGQLGADNVSYRDRSADQRPLAIPPARFRYTDLDIAALADSGDSIWRTVQPFPASILSDPDGTLIDLNADGLPDAMRLAADGQQWFENMGTDASGNVSFDQHDMVGAPAVPLSVAGVQVADLDGDGITDLVIPQDVSSGSFMLYPGTGQGRFGSAKPFQISNYNGLLGAAGFESPEVRLVDIDFDKRTDVIRSRPDGLGGSREFDILLNRGGHMDPQPPCAGIANAYFPQGQTFLADMNGDRMQDLVILEDAGDEVRIAYFPSAGNGAFGRDGRCDHPGASFALGSVPLVNELRTNPAGFHWQDVTNDGLSDLVYIDSAGVRVWLNASGNRLLAVPPISPPAGFVIHRTDLLDLNGNGTTDIVLAQEGAVSSARYLDFAGAANLPANLLTEITNGIGRTTHIDYKSSTADYVADRDIAHRPWRTRVPFPVTIVASRTVTFGPDCASSSNGVSDPCGLDLDGVPGQDRYVTEYRYHDGYYDGREKEFRGFGEVDVISRGDDSEQPTLVTRHRFHTGAPDGVDNDGNGMTDEFTANGGAEEESLKGVPLEVRQETCGANDCRDAGKVFNQMYQRWEIRRLYTPDVCSGDPTVGCCANADCAAVGLGTCGPEDGSHPGRLPEHTCVAGKPVHYVVSTGTRTAVIEGSAARKDLLVETDYDDYGNQVIEKNWGVVDAPDLPPFGCTLTSGVCSGDAESECARDSDCVSGKCEKRSLTDVDGQGNGLTCAGNPFEFSNPTEPDDEKFTRTEYASNTTDWLIRYTSLTEVGNEGGVVEARSRSLYDGLPSGQVHKGNLTEHDESLIDKSRDIPRVRNSYDDFGNVTETKDARDDRRTIEYESSFATFPTGETAYLEGYSLNTRAAYNEGFGVVRRSTSWGRNDGTGPESTYAYDRFGRLAGIVAPGDSNAAPTSSFEYRLADADASGVASHLNSIATHRRETADGGTVDSYQYVDGLGRTLEKKEKGDNGQFILSGGTGFNSRGTDRATWMPYSSATSGYEALDPAGARVTKRYDATGRGTVITNPDNAYSQMVYAPLATDTLDEDDTAGVTPGSFMTHSNDGLGRLIQVIERNGTEVYNTHYAYDARGNLLHITDNQGNQKAIVYDSLSRKTFMNDPDRGHMTWAYDDADNVTRTVDAKAQVIAYTYDRANRVLSENYLDKTGDEASDPIDVTYVYDSPATNLDMGDRSTDTATFTDGYLASVYDLTGEEHTSYDERRRMKWEVKRIKDPQTGALGTYATRFGYDSMDRMTSLQYPDGDRVGYTYGQRGLLSHIQGGNLGKTIVNNVTYRPSGQLDHIEYGNGVVTTYSYDPRLRLIDLRTAGAGASAGTDLIHYQYQFDPVSNITGIDDRRSDVPPGDPRHNTQRFGYDGLHRLTSYRLAAPDDPAATFGTIDYVYDSIGNMVSQTSSIAHLEKGMSVTDLGAMSYGGTRGPLNRNGRERDDPPGPHALTATDNGTDRRAYPYDENGNMTSIDGMGATWDFKDRLAALDSTEMHADYTYDYTNRRITKLVVPKASAQTPSPGPGIVTAYIDRNFEIRDGGQPTKYVFMGDTRVARIEGTLDATSLRVQRLQLGVGWNLLSIAVSADDAAAQLGIGQDPAILQAYRWNPDVQTFTVLSQSDRLPSGSVFWIEAAIESELTVVGTYVPPGSIPVRRGGNFYPAAGLESVSTTVTLPSDLRAWFYDTFLGIWRVNGSPPPMLLSSPPRLLVPGAAFYARAGGNSETKLPAQAARVHYYHQDHLGSTNVFSDDAGTVANEATYYPYGHTRPLPTGNSILLVEPRYEFAQMENDEEDRLEKCGDRYRSPTTSTFLTPDMRRLTTVASTQIIASPQKLNSYTYVANNPVTFVDPSGADEVRASVGLEGKAQAGIRLSFGFGLTLAIDWTVPNVRLLAYAQSGGGAGVNPGAKLGLKQETKIQETPKHSQSPPKVTVTEETKVEGQLGIENIGTIKGGVTKNDATGKTKGVLGYSSGLVEIQKDTSSAESVALSVSTPKILPIDLSIEKSVKYEYEIFNTREAVADVTKAVNDKVDRLVDDVSEEIKDRIQGAVEDAINSTPRQR